MDLRRVFLLPRLARRQSGPRPTKRRGGSFALWLFFAFIAATLIASQPTTAQQTDDPLIMTWDSARPFAFEDENGDLVGLSIDLASELSREIGFEVAFKRSDDLHAMIAEFGAGQAQIMAGIPRIEAISATTVYSTPVFRQETRLMIRQADVATVRIDRLGGLRVGIIAPTVGSAAEILPGAKILPYPNAKAALIDLLSGDIDAISAPTNFTASAARIANVDQLVTYAPGSLLEYDLFVALHESQADLLAPINAALAKMEDDGRLIALARKYSVALPAAVPDVLTVGVYHFPPYQVVQADGRLTGFAVEVMRDVAKQAGIQLTFKEISHAEWQAGPGVGGYDMLPQAGINAERSLRMDFTYPIEQAELSIFVPSGTEAGISGLDDLVGMRVGTSATNLARRLAENRGDLVLVTLGDQEDHLSSLLDGRTDAVLYPPVAMNTLALERGVASEITEIRPAFYKSQRAPALRPGLGLIRERLNAVMPNYLVSEEYRQEHAAWLDEPYFWTRQRVYALIGLGSALLLGFIAFAFVHWQRGQRSLLSYQQRELENETTYNEQLQTVVHQLERSNENLNDFAYIASHDLKEPLRGIAINADFLLREDVSGASKKRIDRMVVLTTRMEQLISDLLFFSRLGRDEDNREKVDLIKIVGHLKSDLREALEEKGGQITVTTHLPRVSVERSRVRTVFYNLIMNGIIYNDSEKKLIEIGFEKSVVVNGQTLTDVFYVKDNGIGIDEKNRDKVYRIFTRLNRESDYGRGSGAGLSFVKKVLEIYNCKLTFSSEVGVGTTFYFSLPVAEPNRQMNKEPERKVS